MIESSEKERDSVAQKTKELSFECNRKITFEESGAVQNCVCHILKCYSIATKDRMMFLQLCDAFFISKVVTIDAIIDFFGIMGNFFSSESKLSEAALVGLYGELYTIYHFSDRHNFARDWQNQDRMKFDFSINPQTKLEVKSTCKQSRVHHFKHEQLATNIVDIYILSYKFRLDNDGLSLEELIKNTIPLLVDYPKKQARLQQILYMYEGDSDLIDLKFHEEYTRENMKFFNASDVPRFIEGTPANVSDVEYDSNCENLSFLEEEEFLELINSLVNVG